MLSKAKALGTIKFFVIMLLIYKQVPFYMYLGVDKVGINLGACVIRFGTEWKDERSIRPKPIIIKYNIINKSYIFLNF